MVFGLLGLFGVLVAVVALVRVHLLPTGLNPIRDAVSDYGAGPHRRWYQTAAVSLGLAGAVVGVGLLLSIKPAPLIDAILLFGFALARILITRFPTDLPGKERTQTGRIHMILAIAGFALLAVAAALLGGAVVHDARWSDTQHLLTVVGWAVVAAVALVVLGLVVPGLRRVFGLFERLYYLGMVIWLTVVSILLLTRG